MSTVILQLSISGRRLCDSDKENNINANASVHGGYALAGRYHDGDMEDGSTRIYEAPVEIIDQATGKKINGLKAYIGTSGGEFRTICWGGDGDWGETQFDGSSTNEVITSYRHYKGNCGSSHNPDENHGFSLVVGKLILKSESTGEEIPITSYGCTTTVIDDDSIPHTWYSQAGFWTKWWKGYDKGDENSQTDYGQCRFKSTSQINLVDYGASLAN